MPKTQKPLREVKEGELPKILDCAVRFRADSATILIRTKDSYAKIDVYKEGHRIVQEQLTQEQYHTELRRFSKDSIKAYTLTFGEYKILGACYA